jgi:hypothetical protein
MALVETCENWSENPNHAGRDFDEIGKWTMNIE